MKTIPLWIGILAIKGTWAFADVDSDQADQPAYKDGWKSGTDGSVSPSSLGAWVLGDNANAANIAIADSGCLNSGKSAIDTGGVSFKLHDPAKGYVDVFRFIDPMGLEVGECLSFVIAVNFRSGSKGVDARDANDATLFNFNGSSAEFVWM